MKRFFALALLGLFAFVGCANEEGAAPAAPAAGEAAPAPADAGAMPAPGAEAPAAPGAPAENP